MAVRFHFRSDGEEVDVCKRGLSALASENPQIVLVVVRFHVRWVHREREDSAFWVYRVSGRQHWVFAIIVAVAVVTGPVGVSVIVNKAGLAVAVEADVAVRAAKAVNIVRALIVRAAEVDVVLIVGLVVLIVIVAATASGIEAVVVIFVVVLNQLCKFGIARSI